MDMLTQDVLELPPLRALILLIPPEDLTSRDAKRLSCAGTGRAEPAH